MHVKLLVHGLHIKNQKTKLPKYFVSKNNNCPYHITSKLAATSYQGSHYDAQKRNTLHMGDGNVSAIKGQLLFNTARISNADCWNGD